MHRAKLRSLIIPVVLTVAPSCLARAECKNERGLLHGIEDVSIAHEYSRWIISNYATALLRDTEYMYNCALRDAHGDGQACNKSLEEIIQTGNRFMQNQVEVGDRQELQNALKKILTKKGRLFFLLGGKSTGELLAINSLEKPNMDSVFVIDL